MIRKRRPARDDDSGSERLVWWLRVAKLLLTVILLAIAVWNALSGSVPV